MREEIDYPIHIESIKENVVDDFCLMFMASKVDEVEVPYQIFYGLPDEYSLGEDLSSPTTDLTSYLVHYSNCKFIPATLSQYEAIMADRSIYRYTPCYHIQIRDGRYKITVETDGMQFVHTLQEWIELTRIISRVNSIISRNEVVDDNKCPCIHCLVQPMCVSSFGRYEKYAEKPCPEYNQWKKYRIRELWNDLPFDIKQYEYEYYKEFLTYKDVLMLT